ncbi:Putative amidase AmiA2 [Baekduia alba]|uniref:amidase n=1 Tax=Baekduia alba TaxID=2997333 RepID=UPI002341CCB8|nr:amidase [Baekduia alba]WCB96183.1 Putative amidase AmiA2 [Baekduia alba]
MSSTSPEAAGLALAGLRRQAELIAAGAVSSVELVDAALARIDAAQPDLNAFRCTRPDAARAEAAAADARRATGDVAGQPLLGVPLAIKDDMDLAGETTAFGCHGAFTTKSVDGEVARRLRAAGAVIVGKTTSPEFGQWPITEGPAFGATRNPWALNRTPGGSSGGSAAAVAAGLVPAALGSDGAGSVRIPAAWTHLVGIKPQRGRISTMPDPEAFQGLTCIGPLARTVADAALLLDAVAGRADGDRHTPGAPGVPFAEIARRAEPGRLRIALSLRIPFSGAPATLDPRVRAAVERLARVLDGLGHEVVRDDPAYGLMGATFIPRSMVGLREWSRRVPDVALLDERTRHNIALGRWVGGPVLRAARAFERPLRAQVGRIFRRVDVVLTPTTAQLPLPIGSIDGLGGWATDKVIVGACPYAWPWNVLGWPGVNVPAGLTGDGLPVGAQLLGPGGSEPRLIALAAQLEAVERWQDRRPPYVAASPRAAAA